MMNEMLTMLPVTERTAPLLLALAVNAINASPLDTRTRLRTYDEIAEALKARVRQLHIEKEDEK